MSKPLFEGTNTVVLNVATMQSILAEHFSEVFGVSVKIINIEQTQSTIKQFKVDFQPVEEK